MDKTGHAAGSYKVIYFFSRTIFKFCSSPSLHTALCLGSLKDVLIKGNISGLHTCSGSYFRSSHLCFMWSTFCLMNLFTPSVCFQQKTAVFHQTCLKAVFCSGLAAPGFVLPCTSLHAGHLQGCAWGIVQAGSMWGPPTCLQGQWVMLVALSPSLLVWHQLKLSTLTFVLSFFLHFLIFIGILYKHSSKVRGHIWSPWENKSGGISCSGEWIFIVLQSYIQNAS